MLSLEIDCKIKIPIQNLTFYGEFPLWPKWNITYKEILKDNVHMKIKKVNLKNQNILGFVPILSSLKFVMFNYNSIKYPW